VRRRPALIGIAPVCRFLRQKPPERDVTKCLPAGRGMLEEITSDGITIIRFENHGAGHVRWEPAASPACEGEDALIAEVRLTQG
jgi:hypothetical protein